MNYFGLEMYILIYNRTYYILNVSSIYLSVLHNMEVL